MITDMDKFWGFSLLRYIQMSFNRGFSSDYLKGCGEGLRTEYIKMPPGNFMSEYTVENFTVDYSLLPRIIEVESEGVESEGVEGVEGEVAESDNGGEWSDFLVGPDIFLRRGCGVGRRLVGIEKCDYFLTHGIVSSGVGGIDLELLGRSVLLVDRMLGLKGKFVQVLWDISQFNVDCKRNVMLMVGGEYAELKGRNKHLCSGADLEKKVRRECGCGGRREGIDYSRGLYKAGIRATSIGFDILSGDYGGGAACGRSGEFDWRKCIAIPESWCGYLMHEYEVLKQMFD